MPTDTELSNISTLAQIQVELQNKISAQEAALNLDKEKVREIKERLLPDAMLEAGVRSFKTTTGEIIEIRNTYRANITAENSEEAFKWLRDNGHGGLIKRELKFNFSKGEDDKASAFLEKVQQDFGYIPLDKEAVHNQTLRAFVREQTEEGRDIPRQLLGVYIQRIADVSEEK